MSKMSFRNNINIQNLVFWGCTEVGENRSQYRLIGVNTPDLIAIVENTPSVVSIGERQETGEMQTIYTECHVSILDAIVRKYTR